MSTLSGGCVTGGREGARSRQPEVRPWFPSWLPPELALTLCRVLALAERVSFQHVLAAGTPVGEQRGLWCPTPGCGIPLWQCLKKGDKERVEAGRQSGSRGLADG